MLQLTHSRLIMISGALWLCVGLFLLPFGINLLLSGDVRPLTTSLIPVFGGMEEATVALIAFALFVGYMKGRFVLGKSSKRIVDRIRSFPNPTSLSNLFSPAYLVLIGSMILLGISIKFFGLPNDVRGIIDVAVGAAMINGALITFRHL
jgi:hypothetical protein